MTFNLSSSSNFGEDRIKLNDKNPRCCPLCKFYSCFSTSDIYVALKFSMPADSAHEPPLNNSVLQSTIMVDILHPACEVFCLTLFGMHKESATKKNLVFFLYQWMYQYRWAEQQTRWSLRNSQDVAQTGISYLVHVSSMTLYSRWSWSEAGSSSSTSALSLCKASERFSSGETDRGRFGAWRCCSDFGSFRLTRSWKAGLAIGSGTL